MKTFPHTPHFYGPVLTLDNLQLIDRAGDKIASFQKRVTLFGQNNINANQEKW